MKTQRICVSRLPSCQFARKINLKYRFTQRQSASVVFYSYTWTTQHLVFLNFVLCTSTCPTEEHLSAQPSEPRSASFFLLFFCQHRITHAYSPQYKLSTSSNHFKWKALASKWMCVPTLKKFHQGVQEIYTLKRRRWKHKKSCLCTIRHWGLFIYQSPSKWNKCSSLTPRLLKLAKTNSSVETKNNNKKVE